MPVIGFLSNVSPDPVEYLTAAFRQGLGESGYIEGRNVAIEYRWADGQNDRLPALAADLIRSRVAVIVATGGSGLAAHAAKAGTATIPIVFSSGRDPVEAGLVTSLSRPEANLTGVSVFSSILTAKRLGLLRELVPQAAIIAVLVNPTSPTVELQLKDVQAAARSLGQKIQIFSASSERDFEPAFSTMAEQRTGALVVSADPYFSSKRGQLIALAARHALPAVYEWREFAESGGLMSYGTILPDLYRQVGVYAGRILKGEKPSDLPVLQPTKYKLVINIKTVKELGLNVPPTLLALADEVIE